MATTATFTTVDRVRGMMTRNNLNQSQMARFLGISQGNIGNWMAGTRQPTRAATRMVDVLEQAEMFYPVLFKSLLARALTK